MRIIRVSGCHDCDRCDKDTLTCNEMILKANIDKDYVLIDWGHITKYYRTKTLPNNCPLEEVDGVILSGSKHLTEMLEEAKLE